MSGAGAQVVGDQREDGLGRVQLREGGDAGAEQCGQQASVLARATECPCQSTDVRRWTPSRR